MSQTCTAAAAIFIPSILHDRGNLRYCFDGPEWSFEGFCFLYAPRHRTQKPAGSSFLKGASASALLGVLRGSPCPESSQKAETARASGLQGACPAADPPFVF